MRWVVLPGRINSSKDPCMWDLQYLAGELTAIILPNPLHLVERKRMTNIRTPSVLLLFLALA